MQIVQLSRGNVSYISRRSSLKGLDNPSGTDDLSDANNDIYNTNTRQNVLSILYPLGLLRHAPFCSSGTDKGHSFQEPSSCATPAAGETKTTHWTYQGLLAAHDLPAHDLLTANDLQTNHVICSQLTIYCR